MTKSPFLFGDIPVILCNLPSGCRGFCCLGSDYEPIIVLNRNMTYEQQRKTYRHEMNHIVTGEIFDPTFWEYGGPNGREQ